jgi:hypothetical protein
MKKLIFASLIALSASTSFAAPEDDNLKCTQIQGPVGAQLTATLTNVSGADHEEGVPAKFRLKVFSRVVYPGAKPKVIASAALTCEKEDVMFYCVSKDKATTFHTYLDELDQTTIELPGRGEISLDCNEQE